MSRSEAFLWIAALFGLEVQHLKWIIWEHWDCRRCHVKNHVCGCKRRLMFLL